MSADLRVSFPTGRYVHWGYKPWNKPHLSALCGQVMLWHVGEITRKQVTCRRCLALKPGPRT